MNISGSFGATYSVTETLAYGLVAADSPQSSDNVPAQFTNGSAGAGLVDQHWETAAAGVTLAASASVTYTLSALTDGLGRAVAFGHVAAFHLRVLTITAGDYLTVAPGATHGWTAFLPAAGVKVRRIFLAADDTGGFAAGVGATDQVTITNSGSNPITFLLALAGTSG